MRKMDEMELEIAAKSIKITWFITVTALYIIGFIQKYQTGDGNIFLLIATLSVTLNIGIDRYYSSKADSNNAFIKFIGTVVLLTGIILLGFWWLSN